MQTTFITCIYYDLDEEFNGRGRKHHYLCSLDNILKLGAPFIIYTCAANRADVISIVDKSENKQVEIIIEELNDLPIYSGIKDLKSKTELIRFRCYEIMHSKCYWIKNVIDRNPFSSTYFFWIDVGLSHDGIFPPKYLRSPESTNWADKYMGFDVFDPYMVNRLVDHSNKDKMFVMCFDQTEKPWSAKPDSKYIYGEYKYLHMIGGLFGGDSNNVKWFCDEVEHYTAIVFDDQQLPTEEIIYSIIVNNNIERFQIFKFNSWYHTESDLFSSWTAPLSYITSFCEFFDH